MQKTAVAILVSASLAFASPAVAHEPLPDQVLNSQPCLEPYACIEQVPMSAEEARISLLHLERQGRAPGVNEPAGGLANSEPWAVARSRAHP